MLNIEQFRAEVARPTLERIGMHSPAAENLVVGTAIQESRLTYLRQTGGGPALGLYQIEPATLADLWDRYLSGRPLLRAKVSVLLAPGAPLPDQLVWNLAFATAIARLRYWIDPAPLPAAGDIAGLAAVWKRVFNTPLGAGAAAEWEANYRRYAIGAGA